MKPQLKGKPIAIQNATLDFDLGKKPDKEPCQQPQIQAQPLSQQQNFQKYMEEKLKSSNVQKAYEEANKKLSEKRQSVEPANQAGSKPFIIKSSQTTQGFSGSQSTKKPFNQFYQGTKIKSIDDSIPKPSSEIKQANSSHISTQKSEDLSREIDDSQSVQSQTFSISKSSNNPSKVQKEKPKKQQQEIRYDSKVWVKLTPITQQKPKFQTKEFQDIMDKVEKMIEQKNICKQQIQKELGDFLKANQDICQRKFQKIGEDAQLEKQIAELAQELQDVETQSMEKKMKIDLERLKQIIDEPLSNDSFLSIKQKSMFITELLKNREMLHSRLNNKTESAKSLQDSFEEAQKRVELMEEKIELQEKKIEEIQSSLTQENHARIEALLKADTSKMMAENPYAQYMEETSAINQKIKKVNPNFKPNEDLGLEQPGILPKDKHLRQEAIERILSIKNQQFNEDLLALARRTGLEERPKMQALIENLKKSVKYQPSEFLLLKMQEFEALERKAREAQAALIRLQGQTILEECQQQKKELDAAIQLSKEIMAQSSSKHLEEELDYVTKRKEELVQIESEFQSLYDQACAFSGPELQEIKEMDEEAGYVEDGGAAQREQLSQAQEQQDEKTTEEIDEEITRKVRQLYPELFGQSESDSEAMEISYEDEGAIEG